LLLRRPEERHEAAHQDAERDRGQHRGEHHLAGHPAHQEHVDENSDREAQHQRGRDRRCRAVREQRRGREQQIGTEHHQLTMREVEHAADPVDQHVAARDQRVDRGQDDDVDDELHGLGHAMSRVPGAAQREAVRCRTGTATERGPGSAQQHFVLQRIRGTRLRITSPHTWSNPAP
jgi:hypothetical protein